MHRIQSSYDTAAISAAIAALPDSVHARIGHYRIVCGVDPVFAGLHGYDDIGDGRSFRDTAHACFPDAFTHRPISDRIPTVVIPGPVAPSVVIHEIGHILHHAVGFDTPHAPAINWYAALNGHEAFAEAFTVSFTPPDLLTDTWRDWYAGHDATLSGSPIAHWFDALARGAELPAR